MAAPGAGCDQISVRTPKEVLTLGRVTRAGGAVFFIRGQVSELWELDAKKLKELEGSTDATVEEVAALKAAGALPPRSARAALVPARAFMGEAVRAGHGTAARLAVARALLGRVVPLPSTVERPDAEEDEEEEQGKAEETLPGARAPGPAQRRPAQARLP